VKQRFRTDTTGTLEHYPSKLLATTSATVALYAPGGGEIQAAASATVDLTSTTVASSAVRGAQSFAVTAASGGTGGTAWAIAKNRKYLVTEGTQVWACEVKNISGTMITPIGEVPFALTGSSTVVGYRLSYALTTTHTADLADDYRASWAITNAGGVDYEEDVFDVVAAIEWYPTTAGDVLSAYPRVAMGRKTRDADLAEVIRQTWRRDLIPALARRGVRIERVRNYHDLVPLHIEFVNLWSTRCEFQNDPGRREVYEDAQRLLNDALEGLFARIDWYDEDDDLTVGDSEQNSLRRIRLVR